MKIFKNKLSVISMSVLAILLFYKLLLPTVTPIVQTAQNPIIQPKENLAIKEPASKPKKILRGTLTKTSSTLGSKDTLPVLEASTTNPNAYFKWVINNGGKIVLTRGGNNKVVGLINNNLRVVAHGTYELPVGMVRVVTNEAAKIWNGRLPNSATRVLMYWPKIKQLALEDKLLSMPFSGHAQRLKATYTVKGENLLVKITQVKASGSWHATNELITL
ncbi:hypothetical protein [Pseudoalteromonas sp. C12FD-1]|uniref:hypothetical protein n=1 Tax=Pseudoalteromonas sp. C12FD-1 TaxID=3131979 RepID=UPI00307DADAB